LQRSPRSFCKKVLELRPFCKKAPGHFAKKSSNLGHFAKKPSTFCKKVLELRPFCKKVPGHFAKKSSNLGHFAKKSSNLGYFAKKSSNFLGIPDLAFPSHFEKKSSNLGHFAKKKSPNFLGIQPAVFSLSQEFSSKYPRILLKLCNNPFHSLLLH
jgi:hypothetical protein